MKSALMVGVIAGVGSAVVTLLYRYFETSFMAAVAIGVMCAGCAIVGYNARKH